MRFLSAWVFSIASFAVVAAAQTKTDYLQSERGDAQHWTGLKWTSEEAALFGGMPMEQTGAVRPHLIVLRYAFHVSHYDAERRVPLWVAHIDRPDSSDKARGRTKDAWGRTDDKFTPDAKIVLYAKSRKLPFVTDASYVNANPPELPIGEKSRQKITRGHLASNLEMKSLGDPDEGLQSQRDSFSLANVVPQMANHNAPIWAKLEDECMEAAKALGTTVAVVSGPVYAPDPKLPPPRNKVIFTTGKDGVAIPIPTHLFKIVLARVNGKPVAVGFLIPHRSDLGAKDLGKFVVPVRTIEKVTGLNFMPDLGVNDAVEEKAEARWFRGQAPTSPQGSP